MGFDMTDDDPFAQLAWLEPDRSPIGIRVLDWCPFSTSMISTTKDPAIAAKFTHLRTATLEKHKGKSPEDALTVRCDLRYPFGSKLKDGPLFVAEQMEDKWDIYLQDGHLYFTRSWTGDLVFRASIAFQDHESIVSEIEANRAKVANDPTLAVHMVDFLVKTHLCRSEAPHPFRPDLPDDKRSLALYSFSEYGRWAFYGSFEDTTKVRVPASR
jgi:hypothetical protein